MKKLTLENVTTEAIKELIAFTKSTKDLLLKEAPVLAREVVADYKVTTVTNLITLSLVSLVLGASTFGVSLLFDAKNPEDLTGKVLTLVVGSIITLIFFGCAMEQVADLVRTKVAPKLIILNYIKNFVKEEKPESNG